MTYTIQKIKIMVCVPTEAVFFQLTELLASNIFETGKYSSDKKIFSKTCELNLSPSRV